MTIPFLLLASLAVHEFLSLPLQPVLGELAVVRRQGRQRLSEPLREPDPKRGTARLRIGGRSELLGSGGATLGRSREADIVIDDANVSRKHAEVRPSGGSWIVRDLGSTNGIKVNGRRVDPSRPQSIKPGDVIELGTSRAIFELE